MVLRQAIKVANLLKNHKSELAFIIHDSIVIDWSQEDKNLISEITKIFGDTDLGQFKVSLSAGKDFGDMKSVKCI